MPDLTLDEHFQLGGLAVLDYLTGLVAGAPERSWSNRDVACLLQGAKAIEDLFEPSVVERYRQEVVTCLVAPGVSS